MKLVADFSKISSSYEQLPEGEYRVNIESIEEGKSSGGLDQLEVKCVVLEGDKEGSVITDFLTLVNHDGKPSKATQSRIKAYAEAVLGDEQANSTEGIDTDDLKGGTCLIVVKHESYAKPGSTEAPVPRAKIGKVLRAD